MGILHENLHTLLSTKGLLVAFLHTQVACIVTAAVIAVSLHISAGNLPDVPEHVSRSIVGILPDRTLLDEKSRKHVKLLLQTPVILLREVGYEFLGCIGGVARIFPGILHVDPFLGELLLSHLKGITQRRGVEILYVARNQHHVIGRLVENHKLTVAVVDETTRRVYYLPQKGVAVGILLIFVIAYLETEKPDDIDCNNQA